MNELYLQFLEDTQAQCLQLLRLGLTTGNGLSIAKNSIQKSLGLSYYKLNQGIKKINTDLSQISGLEVVYAAGDGDTVTFYQLTSNLEKRLRASYAETSNSVLMFKYLYLNENYETRQHFIKRTFMSNSNFFRLRSKIINVTQEIFNITIRSPEELRRQVVFNVFYYFFNGVYFPFDNSDEVNALIQKLQAVYQFHLRPTQLEQLRYFCAIQLYRSKYPFLKGYIPLNNLKAKEIKLTKGFLKEAFPSAAIAENEAAFTYDFLHVTGMIPFHVEVLKPAVSKKIEELTNVQLRILRDNLDIFKTPFGFTNIITSLNQINLRLEFPFFHSSTFSNPAEVLFFKETYPQLHETVMLLVKQTINQTSQLSELATITQLYYTLLFNIALKLPLNSYSETIYVTVDFSQGDLYTHYIVKAVEQLKLSNLVIEQHISSHTDLYLSDIFITGMIPEQVTWENPPKPIDWQYLGDVLINIQNKKYEARSNERFQPE